MSTNENEFFEQLGGYDEPTSINIRRPAIDPEQYPPPTQPSNGAHAAADNTNSVTADRDSAGSGAAAPPQQSAPLGQTGVGEQIDEIRR